MADLLDICIVSTTCAGEAEAVRLARVVLEAQLAACVQILPIRSLYLWQDEIRDESEWLLQMKARRCDWEALEKAICDAHSYDVPEILGVDVAAAHAPYLAWVNSIAEKRERGD
jgi:periplasmic divalent cation tolerance protein